jgi:hypothetical protein
VTTRQRLAVLLIVAASALTLTVQTFPLGPPGIDPGWQWVVNTAGSEGWTVGRDMVFTYGPLGWIAAPQDHRGHLWWAAAFEVLLQLGLGAVLLARLRRAPEQLPAVIVATVVWMIAVGLGLRFEGRVVLVSALLCLDGVHNNRRFSLCSAGALAALTLFIKMSLGVAVGATVAPALAITAHRHGRRTVVPPFVVAALVGLTAAVGTIGSPGAVVQWIRLSLDIVSGYSSAASIIGSGVVLWTGLAMLSITLALGWVTSRRGFGWAVLILLPGLLVHFRLAFVRQDGHQFLFAPFVIGLIAVAIPWLSPAAAWRHAVLSVAGLTSLASLGGAIPWTVTELPRVIVGRLPGPSSVATIARPAATSAALHEASRRNLDALALPEDWRRRIAASGERVTVIPWEVMYGPANDLPVAPLRTIQLYLAHTSRLDEWSAALFTGDDAPGWVLDDFAPTGKRRALLDAPATWRAVYRTYRVDSVRWDPFLMLLRRRDVPVDEPLRPLGRASMETAGSRAPVPPSTGGMVFASVDLPMNALGRLNRSVFRVPLIMTEFHHTDGTRSQARLIPDTAGAGILVDPFPHTVDDYVGLWAGRPTSPVRSIHLHGPGLRYHAPAATVRWLELAPGSGAKRHSSGTSPSDTIRPASRAF